MLLRWIHKKMGGIPCQGRRPTSSSWKKQEDVEFCPSQGLQRREVESGAETGGRGGGRGGQCENSTLPPAT